MAVAALRPPRNDSCGTSEADRWVPYQRALEALAGRPAAGALALTLVADLGAGVSLTSLDVIARVKPAGGEKVLFDALPAALAKPRVWPTPSKGLDADRGLQVLALYKTPQAAALLVKLLPNKEWRQQIIVALGVTEQPQVAAAVVGYLDDPALAEAALDTCLRLGDAGMAPQVKAYCVKLANGQAGPPNEEIRKRRLQLALGVLWALDLRGESFDFIGETLEQQKLSLPEQWAYRDFFHPDILPARVMEECSKRTWSPRHRLAMQFMHDTFGTSSEEAGDQYETWPQRYARVGNQVVPLLLACAERGNPVIAREALRALTWRARHTTDDQKLKIRQMLHRLANAPAPRPFYLADCLCAYPDADTPALLTRMAGQAGPDQLEAATRLLSLDRPAAMAALRKMLDSKDPFVQRGAAHQLVHQGDGAGVPVLLEAAAVAEPGYAVNYAQAVARYLKVELSQGAFLSNRPAELARLRTAWLQHSGTPAKTE